MHRLNVRRSMAAATILCITGCQTAPTGPAQIPVTPMCSIQLEVGNQNLTSWNGRVFVSYRNDASFSPHYFSPFAAPTGPIGASGVVPTTQPTGIPNVFGFSEGTLEQRGNYELSRAQLIPKLIKDSTDASVTVPFGVEWRVDVRDSTGNWSSRATGTTQLPDQLWEGPGSDSLRRTPRFMSVGDGDAQIFACAGLLTEDERSWSTWLISPTSGSIFGSASSFIQDLLGGDRYFVPNKQIPTAPLAPPSIGPPAPPVPTNNGQGSPIDRGSVDCAMSQQGDDVATRTLHMMDYQNGRIVHATASNWGPVTQTQTDGSTRTFSRFRSESGWGDVLQVINQQYPDLSYTNVTAAAIAAQGNLLHLFFVENSTGGWKLHHAVRFPSGSWRRPVDVFASNGNGPPSGFPNAFRVAAGACPAFGSTVNDPFDAEVVVAFGGIGGPVNVISVVRQPQPWGQFPSSVYSPIFFIRPGEMDSQSELYLIRGLHVVAVPF